MLAIKTLIRRVRARLHDREELDYLDEDILDALNSGIRYIRRTIMELRPSLLLESQDGTLDAGENTFQLNKRPARVVHLTCGDNIIKSETTDNSPSIYRNADSVWHNNTPIYTQVTKDYYSEKGLEQVDIAHVIRYDNDRTGKPEQFYQTGEKTITLYPTPDVKTKYTILYIPDIEEVTIEDKSPFLTEYDDFLIEYATIRLAMSNEFDMSQEMSIMQNIYQQIRKLLLPPPAGITVKGYF